MQENKKWIALVVEDDEKWLERVKNLLEENGFYVVTAENLTNALKILDTSQDFHFAHIDLQLDKNTLVEDTFEGWKILETILDKGMKKIAPVYILTGYMDESDVQDRMKVIKEHEATFFMSKKNWDANLYIDNVVKAVNQLGTQFYINKNLIS
ncbi:response regulator [candidate division KSB1 bacterium]|nr:response regulator [candidate division KSB1 bacterium]RQW03155.1 MAG: response regulator [candidate division KSB1 bacterium]